MGMKTCSACLKTKALVEFSSVADVNYTKQGKCKACRSLLERRRYLLKKEEISIKRIARYYNDSGAARAASREWYAANTARALASARNWSINNRGKSNSIKQKYKAAKRKAAPQWLTELDVFIMEEYYCKVSRLEQTTGKDYHVDHICPLQGKTVCGLHVPWNLQILEARLNIQKSNKLNYMDMGLISDDKVS